MPRVFNAEKIKSDDRDFIDDSRKYSPEEEKAIEERLRGLCHVD